MDDAMIDSAAAVPPPNGQENLATNAFSRYSQLQFAPKPTQGPGGRRPKAPRLRLNSRPTEVRVTCQNASVNESDNEVGIHIAGGTAVLAGDPDLVQSLLSRLEIRPEQVQRVGRGTADLLAQVTGLGAVLASFDSSWVQLTPESQQRLAELAKFNFPKDGILSGALRGDKGRIDSFAQFTPGGLNPLVLSNVATLTATMALRTAVAQLEALVQSMDVKLDRLLEDNRTKTLGDIQGLTQVLARAFELYEETGRITDTAWSQIAGHATALAQANSLALAHIDSLTQSLNYGSFASRVDAASHIAATELRFWLVVLAACQANQQRLETLELVRLRQSDPESVQAHASSVEAGAEERRRRATVRLQSLLDATASAADVSDLNRVRRPQKSRLMLDSAERTTALLGKFAEIYGVDTLSQGHVERESWRKSLSDFATTTAAAVTSVAKGIPAGLAKAGGDVVIRAASQIEAKRTSGEDSAETGLADSDSEPKQE